MMFLQKTLSIFIYSPFKQGFLSYYFPRTKENFTQAKRKEYINNNTKYIVT